MIYKIISNINPLSYDSLHVALYPHQQSMILLDEVQASQTLVLATVFKNLFFI